MTEIDHINIERAESKQLNAVRDVCYATTTDAFKDKRELVQLMYCDYYILDQPENCWVARDGEKIVGYVLSAEARRYCSEFLALCMPRVKQLSLKYAAACKAEAGVAKKMRKQGYDYHLHIDILDEYQRMGIGHKLVDALCKDLKKKGASGVFLTVDANNHKGVGFYKKYGFSVLKENRYFLRMGISFEDPKKEL